MSFLRQLEQQGYRARADRRYLNGTVVDVDLLAHTCSVDVGATDVNGNPVYLQGISFNPATPPAVGSQVNLLYGNSSPHSAVIAVSQLGGGNPQSAITVVGAVTSLAAAGGLPLQGAVNLAAGSNVQLSESGQTITIGVPNAMTNPMTAAGDLMVGGIGGTPQRLPVGSNGQVLEVVNGTPTWANLSGGGSPASTVQPVGAIGGVGTSTNYAREDHVHQGVHSLAVSGNGGLTGDVVLAAGSGVTLSQSGSQITIAAGGGGWTTGIVTKVSLPYTIGSTEQIVVVIGGTGGLTLPLAANYPNRLLCVKNGTGGALSPVTFYVAPQGSDAIDTRTSYNYQLNPIGSTAYVEAWFVSDGRNTWWSVAAGS